MTMWTYYLSNYLTSVYKLSQMLGSIKENPKTTTYIYLHRHFVESAVKNKHFLNKKIDKTEYKIKDDKIKDDQFVLFAQYNLYWEWMKWKYEYYNVKFNSRKNLDLFMHYFTFKIAEDLRYRFEYYIQYKSFPIQNNVKFFCPAESPMAVAINVDANSYLLIRENKIFDDSKQYIGDNQSIQLKSHELSGKKQIDYFQLNPDQIQINAESANNLIQNDLIQHFTQREIELREQSLLAYRKRVMKIHDVVDVREWWWSNYNGLRIDYLGFLNPTTIFWKKFIMHINNLRKLFNRSMYELYTHNEEILEHFNNIVVPYRESHHVSITKEILDGYPSIDYTYEMIFAPVLRMGIIPISNSIYTPIYEYIPKLFEDLRAFRKFILPYKTEKRRLTALVQSKIDGKANIYTLLSDGCDSVETEELLQKNVFRDCDIVVF